MEGEGEQNSSGAEKLEAGIWEAMVHGWIAAPLGSLKCINSFEVAFLYRPVGIDIMDLCLMLGSHEGYDLTLGLW